MNSPPFFSIITPTSQAREALPQTCHSLYNQNFTSYEHIIIDGGSTDRTVEWLQQNLPSQAYYISEADQGIYDAINKGIQLAQGWLINVLNAGDLLEPNALNLIAQEYENKPFDMAVGQYYWIDPQQDILVTPNLAKLAQGYPICHQAVFYHRQLHQVQGLYDLKYPKASDYKFIRQVQQQKGIDQLNFPICRYDLSGVSAQNFLTYAKEVSEIDRELGRCAWRCKMTYWNKWWRFQIRSLLKKLHLDISIYRKIIHSNSSFS